MRIDSHQHFWHYDPQRDTWITDAMGALKKDFLPTDLAPHLEAQQLDGSIAVQADQSLRETDFLLDLAEDNDQIKGVVGWIDLRSASLWAQLEEYAERKKLVGFRHILQAEPAGFMLQEDFVKGLSDLANADFTYDLLIYEHQMDEALELMSQVPENLQVVIDHLAKPKIAERSYDQWAYNLQQLAERDNCYLKVSGMVTEANWSTWQKDDFRPYVDLALELFGPERIMYGSDWPVCLLAASYEDVFGILKDLIAELSTDEQRRIFGETAAEFYTITPN